MKKGKSVEEIQVGDSAEFSKSISENEVRQFEGIIGDPGCSCAKESLSSDLTPKTERPVKCWVPD